MKNHLLRLKLTFVLLLAISINFYSQTITNTKAEIIAIIQKANDYWQKNNSTNVSSFWDKAAYHTGNMEAYSVTGVDAYKIYSENWAKYNRWIGATGNNKANWKYSYGEGGDYVLFGDNQICFQTYIDLYNITPDPQKIARATDVMSYQINTPNKDYWWWADGLYMVMPVMTKMYKLTGNQLYLDKLYEYFNYADSIMYDKTEQLYYRDGTYVYPTHTTLSGGKDFWARGDGWVFAGLAKVLKDIPLTDAHKALYESRFKNMAASLIKIQQSEGYWSRSLQDTAQAPGRETSGTAFITYGLLWGINNVYLDRETYLPAASKGWTYLSTIALQANGSVGYVQPIGSAAVPGQIITASNVTNFGTGAFLLAASELTRFDGLRTAVFRVTKDSKNIFVYPNPSSGSFTVENKQNSSTVIELFELTGKLLKKVNSKGLKTKIDISTFSPGVYVLKVDNQIVKVVKN